MKKILIVPSFPIWPLYGNEIDLIKQLSEEKNFIKVLNCKKTPQYCAANTFKFKNFKKIDSICSYCTSKLSHGFDWIGKQENIQSESYLLLNKNDEKKLKKIEIELNSKIDNEKDLQLLLRNIDENLFLSIKSTLATKYQNPDINIFDDKKSLILITLDSVSSYLSASNHFKKFNPDEVYIYNGRMARFSAFYRYAKKKLEKKNIFTYEYPKQSHEGLFIIKGSIPHDFENLSQNLKKTILKKKVNRSKLKSFGTNYLKKVFEGKQVQMPKKWENRKIQEKLPEDFDKKKLNISIFLSSEYENKFIKENEEKYPYKNQLEGLICIEKILNKNLYSNINVYVRLHPNMGRYKHDYETLLKNFIKSKKFFIIGSDSAIDSHKLGTESDIIITFGSSMAVDMSFLNKRVFNAGPSPAMAFNIYKHFFRKQKFENELAKELDKHIKKNIPTKFNKKRFLQSSRFVLSYKLHNSKNKYYFSKTKEIGFLKKNNATEFLSGNKFLFAIYLLIRLIGKIAPFFRGTLNKS